MNLIITHLIILTFLICSFLFFFSSRRRHTRWPRDWSSDVCSSDLADDPDRHRAHGCAAPLRLLRDPAGRDHQDGRLRLDLPLRSEEHTSELQSRGHLVCRLLLEKKKRCRPNSQRSSSDRTATSSAV